MKLKLYIKPLLNLIIVSTFTCFNVSAQITGTVFRDYNANGFLPSKLGL